VEAFTWATRLDPSKAPYFYYHGICLANIPRRKHEAEESLQKAVKLDPTKVEYPIELSNLYLKSNLRTKAVDVLNNALKRNPNSPKLKDASRRPEGPSRARRRRKEGRDVLQAVQEGEVAVPPATAFTISAIRMSASWVCPAFSRYSTSESTTA